MLYFTNRNDVCIARALCVHIMTAAMTEAATSHLVAAAWCAVYLDTLDCVRSWCMHARAPYNYYGDDNSGREITYTRGLTNPPWFLKNFHRTIIPFTAAAVYNKVHRSLGARTFFRFTFQIYFLKSQIERFTRAAMLTSSLIYENKISCFFIWFTCKKKSSGKLS